MQEHVCRYDLQFILSRGKENTSNAMKYIQMKCIQKCEKKVISHHVLP